MSLIGYGVTPEQVGADLLRALERATGRCWTVAETKRMARRLIERVVPAWRPGVPLGQDDARKVGAELELLMCGPLDAVQWVLDGRRGDRP